MAPEIQDFFTPRSITTYAGATVAVYVLSNTIRILFKRNSVWISFTIAMLVSFVGAYAGNLLKVEFVSIVLSLLNGCLLFLSAVGAQETVAHAAAPKPIDESKSPEHKSVTWTSSWFKAN